MLKAMLALRAEHRCSTILRAGDYDQALAESCRGEGTLRPLGGWPMQFVQNSQLVRIWGFTALQVGRAGARGDLSCMQHAAICACAPACNSVPVLWLCRLYQPPLRSTLSSPAAAVLPGPAAQVWGGGGGRRRRL